MYYPVFIEQNGLAVNSVEIDQYFLFKVMNRFFKWIEITKKKMQ
jgi:hypothetical protein